MLLTLFIVLSTPAFATVQVATVTQVDGAVMIFTHPSDKLDGPAPHARFEGVHYTVRNAKPGDRVEKGNILRTAPGSKARVVYDNGDSFSVGPGTAYQIKWEQDAAKTSVTMDLMYGKIRGVVEKGGPRSKFLIRTKTATMGVRGTDFFIASAGGANEGTEVTIMRGAVQVAPRAPVSAKAPAAKPVVVESGQSAEVAAPPPAAASKAAPAAAAPVIELRTTTKEELVAIKQASHVPKKLEPAQELSAAPTEVSRKLEALEKKAVETTMQDIKVADPKLYAQIKSRPVKSAEEVDTIVVNKLEESAPKSERRKPFRSELEDLEQGAYEKYFHIED